MKVAIVLNGKPPIADIVEPFVICADGGYRLLNGKALDVLLGDFDSIEHIPQGVKTVSVPAEKNFTDGEMAVRYAVDLGATEAVIYGADGGRLDHVFANFALLKLAFDLGLSASIKGIDYTAEYVEGTVVRCVTVGQTVSIYPFGGSILVAHSKGLYYPLENLHITLAGASRGVSNIAVADTICYDIAEGGAILFVLNAKQ